MAAIAAAELLFRGLNSAGYLLARGPSPGAAGPGQRSAGLRVLRRPCPTASPLCSCPPPRAAGGPVREPGMRQLRLHPDPAVEEGRHRQLPVQRLRALHQNERSQPAPHQAPEESGEWGWRGGGGERNCPTRDTQSALTRGKAGARVGWRNPSALAWWSPRLQNQSGASNRVCRPKWSRWGAEGLAALWVLLRAHLRALRWWNRPLALVSPTQGMGRPGALSW